MRLSDRQLRLSGPSSLSYPRNMVCLVQLHVRGVIGRFVGADRDRHGLGGSPPTGTNDRLQCRPPCFAEHFHRALPWRSGVQFQNWLNRHSRQYFARSARMVRIRLGSRIIAVAGLRRPGSPDRLAAHENQLRRRLDPLPRLLRHPQRSPGPWRRQTIGSHDRCDGRAVREDGGRVARSVGSIRCCTNCTRPSCAISNGFVQHGIRVITQRSPSLTGWSRCSPTDAHSATERSKPISSDRILQPHIFDICCGTGIYALILTRLLPSRAYGKRPQGEPCNCGA